jgi:RNA polymerase sigma-70 factor (ECF subfamily)
MDEALDVWFTEEILVHAADLDRYLARVWPHRDEVRDLRQEVYVKVYEAAAKSRPQSPRAFLFATARNLLADRVRHARIVSIEVVGGLDALNVLIDEISPEQEASGRQELKRLGEVMDRLPARCREIVWLRRVYDMPLKEIATRLGITEKTVEKQLTKGVRLMANWFGSAPTLDERGTSVEARGESVENENE